MFKRVCNCEVITNCFNGLFFPRASTTIVHNGRVSEPSTSSRSPEDIEMGVAVRLTISKDIMPEKTKGGLLNLCLHYAKSRLTLTFGHEYMKKWEDEESEIRKYFSDNDNIEILRSYTIQRCKEYYTLQNTIATREREWLYIASPYNRIGYFK